MKKHKLKYALFVADFETTAHKNFTDDEILAENQVIESTELNFDFTPNESSQVFICGLKSITTNEYKLSYEKISDLFDNLCEMTYAERKKQCVCYFHNLKYDGSYILRWLIKHNWKQTLQLNQYHQEKLERHQYTLLVSNGKWFKLSLYWRGIKIIFLDSLKLLPQSLKKLANDLLEIKKLEDIPYDKFKLDLSHKYPKLWIDYLKRDVDILGEIMKIFFSVRTFSMRQLTIGSIAYKNIKDLILEKIPDFTIKDYNFYFNWYHGGLTFPSLKYWGKWVYKKDKIKLIDANSMYPSVMCDYLPFGTPSNKPLKEWEHYVAFHKIKIIKAEIKKEYNDIAVIWKPFENIIDEYLVSKKLFHITSILPHYQYIQEIQNETYYVCDKELDMWNKLYNMKYKILETYYFESDTYLKDTIHLLYKDKTEAKKLHNDSKYLFSKLVLNNLYGKTGQAPIRSQTFYGDSKDIPNDRFHIKCEKKGIYGGYELIPLKEETDKAQPIFLAAYITSLARVSLLTQYLVLKKQGGIFLYCDTDSIIYIDSAKGVKFNNLDDIELCKWSFDITNADAFCSLCPKQYRIIKDNEIIKSASAGVKKEDMNKVPNKDYNYDCGEKYHLIKRNLKDSELGKVIWDSPFNFLKWKKLKKNPILPKELKF